MKLFNCSPQLLATGCLLFSASLWGIIWYPLRLLEQAGFPGLWTALVMNLAAALLAIPVLFKHRGVLLTFRTDLLILAFAAGVTNVAFILAMIEGEVMRVMLLFYLSPLWSVLLGWLWLGERLSFRAVMMLILALAGSLIMLWDPSIGWPWPSSFADSLALSAGIAFSINNVVTRKMVTVPLGLKVGATWWGVMLMALSLICWQQLAIPQVEFSLWLSAWFLGWFGIVVMTLAVLYGVTKLPVYRSSVIMLFELVVAALAAWWLTEELMTQKEWLGGCLILIAAYGVARVENQKP